MDKQKKQELIEAYLDANPHRRMMEWTPQQSDAKLAEKRTFVKGFKIGPLFKGLIDLTKTFKEGNPYKRKRL